MNTAGSSNMPAEETTHAPATKVRRTYGRKKEVEGLNPLVQPGRASSSRVRSPMDLEGVQEDSSLLRRTFSGDEDASDYSFGWKKKLAEIDRDFDEETSNSVPKSRKASSEAMLRKSSSTPSVSTDDSIGRLDDSLFSIPPLTSSQTEESSPPAITYKSKKNTTHVSDESETEEILIRKDLSPTSPLHPHPLNTLGTNSSPTPPSSDVENEGLPSKNKAPLRQTAAAASISGPSRSKTKGTIIGGKDATKKLKKLNKKEEKESKKAHARIMNEQHVSVAKKSEQLTINDLLGKIRQSNTGHTQSSAHAANVASSDPIQDFTSSPQLQPAIAPAESSRKPGPSNISEESDEELPDLQGLLQQQEQKRRQRETEAVRKKELTLAKQRILAAKFKSASKPLDSDDDDLEVVDEERHPKRSAKNFDYEKKLAGVAGFRVKGGRHSLPENLEGSQGERALKAAAKPAFIDSNSRRTSTTVDHQALQAAMLNKASKQSVKLRREKEEEWIRRGGKLPGKQRANRETEALSLEMLAAKLSHEEGDGEQREGLEEDGQMDPDDESDGDWKPDTVTINRGSASPSEVGSADEEELSGNDTEGENQPIQQHMDTREDENGETTEIAPRRTFHITKRLVVSDSEDEGEITLPPPRVLVPETSMIIDVNDPTMEEYIRNQSTAHRGSISSVSESTPDEDNKENDTRLMFDHGEDKENLSVPRHNPGIGRALGSRQSSGIFDLEEQARRLSVSPRNDNNEGNSRKSRKPLQSRKFGDLEDPFTLRSPTAFASNNTPKASPKTSPKASRASSKSTSPKALAPPFGVRMGGFSQLFNDEDGVLPSTQDMPKKAFLQPAFRIQSKLEDSSLPSTLEPKPLELGGFSQMFSPEPQPRGKLGFKRPGSSEELSLTLDTKLQPAIEVSTQIRRKAESIFDKEQAFVLEDAALSKPPQQKPELYVTETGMLTQTKPDVSTPVIYRAWSPSQEQNSLASQATGPPPTTQRIPLRTLSLTSDSLSPTQPQRLSRLVKGKGRALSPIDSAEAEQSTVPMSKRKDAFSVLIKGAQKQNAKRLLQKSEFIEGEALESDEDETFGFGGPKKIDDDESDSDDPDANVDGLLDDTVIDAEQLAEDKVLEKVQEQLEQDDAALQKYHEAAIEGKYRSKRRGRGIAMDDSDSDPDEDEEARQLRKRLRKKRKVDGDTLESLKKDPASISFYDAYQKDVQEDDNDDFAHLAEDEMLDDDDEENQQPETVSTSDIQAQLREAARQKLARPSRPFNPEDVQWAIPMDLSDDENLEVNEIDMSSRKAGRTRTAAGEDFDMLPKESSNWNSEQLAAWKREQSGRHLGTGGMRGAVTVTGHGAKGERSASALSRTSKFASREKVEKRKLSKAGSMLMKVSDKQSRFG